MDDPTSFFFLI